jgi:hypothetical protein
MPEDVIVALVNALLEIDDILTAVFSEGYNKSEAIEEIAEVVDGIADILDDIEEVME